jgi:hypothetical protein
MKGPKL